ncbi:MAG: hypothetical protein E4H14_08720 [Candidatus Thorarchaeota archaeon]|nr:MAG: hypothetical protein E4H14_08720 [Candidatus Thorarchaeota archaeon]
MKTIQKTMIGLFLVVALLGTTALASAQGPATMPHGPGGPPEQTKGSDGTISINTDIISIMANGEMPMFHFWYAVDDDGAHAKFSTSFVMIAEFEDLNEDGGFQTDEVLYFAPLSAYEWTLTHGVVEENGVITEAWLKYTKSGVRSTPMSDAVPAALNGTGGVMRFEDTTIQIWGHIYLEDYQGEVRDDHGSHANYTVAGGSELKIDIAIGNFPFSSEDSMVTIQTLQREHIATGESEPQINRHRIQTREQFRNTTIDSNNNWTTTGGNESRFESMNGTHIQKIDFVDYDTSLAQGFFSWVDEAVITLPGGATETVPVNATYVPTGVGTAVYLSYPYFDNGSILHDPSIGLYPEGAPILSQPIDIIIVAGIGAVALVAVLIVLVRKK